MARALWFPATAARARKALRWATVAGQLLQSATSFLLTLVFARALAPAAFGSLVVFSLVFILLMTLFRTVLGEQLIARPSVQDVRSVGQLALLTGAIYVVVGCALALLLGQEVVLGGVVAFGSFAASDGVRYAWMAIADARDQIVLLSVDLVRAGAAGAALALAADLPIAADALALLASTLWLGVGLVRYGRPRVRALRAFLATRGAFELAMLTQFLIGTGVAQFLPVLGLWAFSASIFGDLRLAQSVVAPAATFAGAFQPLMLRAYARTTDRGKNVRLTLQLLAVAGVACIVLLPIGVPVAATFVTGVLGARGVAVLPFLLPAAVGAAAGVLSQPGGALIRVRRLTRASLAGQLVSASVGIVLGIAGTATGDPVLFAWALTGGALAGNAAAYIVLFRSVR